MHHKYTHMIIKNEKGWVRDVHNKTACKILDNNTCGDYHELFNMTWKRNGVSNVNYFIWKEGLNSMTIKNNL